MNKADMEKCIALLNETSFAFDDGEKKLFLEGLLSEYNEKISTFSAFRQKVIVLRGVGKFEDAAKMQIAKMPPDMIDDLFYGYNTSALGTLKIYHGILREYLAFMEHSGEELELGYLYLMSMTVKDLKKYLNVKAYYDSAITPTMIDKYVKKSMSADPCAMAATVLIWEGVPVQKIPEIRATDVSFDEVAGVAKVLVDKKEYATQYVDLFKAALEQDVVRCFDDEGNLKAELMLQPECKYFIKTARTLHDNGLKEITITKMKARIKMLAVYLGNKQFNSQNIIVSRKVYEMVKHFDFKEQTYTAYHDYLVKNNIRFNATVSNAWASKMLQKLEDEKRENQ